MIENEVAKPDGGYGWCILLVTCSINIILDGCMYSFGIILNRIKDYYQVRQDTANLVASLNLGLSYLAGPLASALDGQFGGKAVVIGSSFIYSLTYFLTAFSSSIYFVIFWYGIVGGIAFGCAFITPMFIIVDYFDKKLGLVNGLTIAGTGLGALIFAPFIDYLVDEYDWKNTMIILGCLTWICCLLGFFLKPLKKSKKQNSLKKYFSLIKWMEILVEVTKETANFKLLKENDAFFLFSWSNFFLHLAYLTPFIYIPIRAHELGIIDYAFLLSIIGICSIPATIIFGIFSDRKIAAPVTIYAVFTLVMGSMFFIYTSLNTFFLQSIYALMFSLSMGGLNSYLTPYIIELVGSDNYRNASGIVNFFLGIGFIIGPYIAGYLSESTGSTHYSHLFSGVSCFISSVFILIILFKNKTY